MSHLLSIWITGAVVTLLSDFRVYYINRRSKRYILEQMPSSLILAVIWPIFWTLGIWMFIFGRDDFDGQ